VREAGWQRGISRPAVIYEVAPEAEAGFSRAYIPFVAHLVQALRARLQPGELRQLMQLVGRSLASGVPRFRGDLAERVQAASMLLDDWGALNDVQQRNGGYVIRSRNCLL